MSSFLSAVRFLTRLPFAQDSVYHSGLSGEAVSGYAPVGMLIGLVLAAIAWFLWQWLALAPAIVAIIVLAIWSGITGALHLDGLADCGDAWMGGHTAEQMLEIMKDTACGVGAIVAVSLVLLAKFSALSLLLQQGDWILLLFPPVIARMALSIVICVTPYIRHDGIGASLQSNLSIKMIAICGLVLAVLLCLISWLSFVISVLASAIACSLIYYGFIKRVQGATGDIYGALVEITESFVLIGLVI